MRRISGRAAIRRAVEGVAVAPSVTGNSVHHHRRLFQAAPFSTNSNNSSARSHRLSFNRIAGDQSDRASVHLITGAMLFSVVAATVVEDVHAKETVQSEFRPNDVVLYQYEACPFCNKVKAFLDYYNIPYKVEEVNPISKKEIKWSDYKKVPILTVDGEQMVDSSAIIDKLAEKISPDPSIGSAIDDGEEKKWRG